MECNKDEAAKAKLIAEKKFEAKDVMGARKFAMKAHNLFPGLEGLQPLLATLNIYLSAERKINGEVDWYGVLGVEPSSDDETVRKQYRKLALTLHPDKNKSVGAEGAFKILSEAWSLLSDKARRTIYDQKRSAKRVFEKVVPKKPSKSVGSDSLHRSANNGNFNMRSQNAPNPHLNSVRPPQRNTFWTMCTSCKMQFEYVLFYLNKKLECYNCKDPFLAIQIPPPETNSNSSQAAQLPQDTSNYPFASGNAGSMPAAASSAAQAMNGMQIPRGNSKRVHENSQVTATMEAVFKSKTNAFKANAGEANGACSSGKGEKPKRRRRSSEHKMNDSGTAKNDVLLRGNAAFSFGSPNGCQNGTTETEKVSSFGTRLPDISRELSLLETRNMLMEKAKNEIRKKLNEWKNMDVKLKALIKECGPKETKEKTSSSKTQANPDVNGVRTVGSKSDTFARDKHTDVNLKTSSPSSSEIDPEANENVPSLSMTVPDPDFHDFDSDRTEKSFGDNQVWAAYDDEDGMPRYYAIIHSVISRKPFKMRISWLNSKSTSEFGALNWVGCGFYKTNGDFRVGRYELNKSVNSFSHRVKWTKGARGVIRIYPSKGDVWALYRNWSPEWNEHTPDEVIHQYDMVEVLDDYNPEIGATVLPLVKVTGFKTVFRKYMDQDHVRVIPRDEMFRFSHQVPSFLLTGQESPIAPKGCCELDPAATPVELLEVTTEVAEEVRKENTEKVARIGVPDPKEASWSNIATSEARKMG
ncbi:uncharacterized protein LOC110739712 isoform X1 [Chenopodium quinoa]|uniref:uncharacterized protein LOC110739712 isoform X1 n=1 Tax=Chenopodium quinoa TaxID=63459 RepID=UPI000B7986D0|nr:uncharacterized protein LOC110739712 isoform X1 [Chenopodium quinoa]